MNSIELRNINGNSAEVWDIEADVLIACWDFLSPPKLINTDFTSLSIILKMKEAGFTGDEILRINTELTIVKERT